MNNPLLDLVNNSSDSPTYIQDFEEGFNKLLDSHLTTFRETHAPHLIPDLEHTRLVTADFPQLSPSPPTNQRQLYFDHAGTTLYARQVLQNHMEDLMANIYGNPHSSETSPSSARTITKLNDIRRRILVNLFGNGNENQISDYELVFTKNATGALQLVGQIVDCDEFWYLRDSSHTSVIGMREIFKKKTNGRCKIRTVGVEEVEAILNESTVSSASLIEESLPGAFPSSNHTNDPKNNKTILFSYPVQCNFSGKRFPLSWCHQFRQLNNSGKSRQRYWTLLDASSFLTTSSLNIQDNEKNATKPDFMVLSFYKIFGYPTSLGALLVKKDMIPHLAPKGYFGGGTVAGVGIDENNTWVKFRNDFVSKYEDGTVPFLEILALGHAMEYVEKSIGGWDVIRSHSLSVARFCYEGMELLNDLSRQLADSPISHWNETEFVELFSSKCSPLKPALQGPIITFNMSNIGTTVTEFARLASVYGIHLRVGCFCNPGACAKALNLTDEEIRKGVEQGHVCSGEESHDGVRRGAIRLSFSWMNSLDDVGEFLTFMVKYFMIPYLQPFQVPMVMDNTGSRIIGVVQRIMIYPIKSCHGYQASSSKLSAKGLEMDRVFAIINSETNKVVTLKDAPKLARLRVVNIENNSVQIEMDGKVYSVSLHDTSHEKTSSTMCGKCISGIPYTSPTLSKQFTSFLGFPAHLSMVETQPHSAPKSFANDSPLLLINTTSLTTLSSPETEINPDVFRANIILKLQHPWLEEALLGKSIRIRNTTDNTKPLMIQLTKPCQRCRIINIDPENGDVDTKGAVMRQLMMTRRKGVNAEKNGGGLVFGVYGSLIEESNGADIIHVGDVVEIVQED